jgi:hypothetical protein
MRWGWLDSVLLDEITVCYRKVYCIDKGRKTVRNAVVLKVSP